MFKYTEAHGSKCRSFDKEELCLGGFNGASSKFYKYVSASTALIALESSRLRWSSPSIFDDPAEFRRMPRFVPTISEASKTFSKTLVRAALGQFPLREAALTPTSRLLLSMTVRLIKSGKNPVDLIAELGDTDPAVELSRRCVTLVEAIVRLRQIVKQTLGGEVSAPTYLPA